MRRSIARKCCSDPPTNLVEELRSVFDPKGGYWNKGKYMPSLVAEIGDVIEQHLIAIGMIRPPELDETQKKFLDAKRSEFELTATPGPSDMPADTQTEPTPQRDP